MWEDFDEPEKVVKEKLEPAKPKGMSSWQVMSSVYKPNIKPSEEDISKINSYFFCSYLSQDNNSLPIAQMLNKYYNIPVPIQYRYARDYADMTQMAKKIKFIQFSKKKIPAEMTKILENISKKYNINNEAAMEYFQLMDNEQRQIIYNIYDVGIQN